MSPKNYYEGKIKKLTAIVQEYKRKSNLVSILRLCIAAIAIVLIVFLFKESNAGLWFSFSISILTLLVLIKFSNKLKQHQAYNEELLIINQNEIKALSRDFLSFNSGEEFIDPNHSFSYDLDVFGKGSIFQLICRTCTLQGKDLLAESLKCLETETNIIVDRQNAVIELKDKIEWRQAFQAVGQLASESRHDKDKIERWLAMDHKFYGNKVYAVLIWLLPITTFLCWGLALSGTITFVFPIVFSAFQFFLTLINIKHVNLHHGVVHKSVKTIKKFHQLIKVIENENFDSEELNKIKEHTFHKNMRPSQSFAKLVKLVNGLDNRVNYLLAFFLNCVFLSDINYVYRIERWAHEFRAVFPFWINAVAKFDAFSSLACFMYNNPGYALPEISDSKEFVLSVTNGGHPLLEEEELVTNDLIQDGEPNLFLITGANMGGKSTFLRMIGMNLILAMSGTCVCATRFKFTPVQLYTSMRTNDSLQRQTSFFFAELKRLKFIIEQLKSGKKTYILLDEILKGTNSKDQHLGSTRLIENIINLNGFGMIATHDVELTNLKAKYKNRISNIAFEIEIEKDKMIFDYKYRDGVCKNMNATLLMEQMNIF